MKSPKRICKNCLIKFTPDKYNKLRRIFCSPKCSKEWYQKKQLKETRDKIKTFPIWRCFECTKKGFENKLDYDILNLTGRLRLEKEVCKNCGEPYRTIDTFYKKRFLNVIIKI